MNRKSNTSSLSSIYSEQSNLNSPNFNQTSFSNNNNEQGIEEENDVKSLNQLRTITINSIGFINKDERKKFTPSSIGTISSTEGLLPAFEVTRSSLEGYSENSSPNSSPSTLSTNLSIASINSTSNNNSPITPPQRSPLRLKPTIQLPKLVTSSTSISTGSLSPSSTATTTSTTSTTSTTFPFPSPTGSNNISNGPGYELISLEEARRRVAAARNSPIISSPSSTSNNGFEGSTLTPNPSSSSTTLKSKKSGFFRRKIGSDEDLQNSTSTSTSTTGTKFRSVSSPILTNTTFNSINSTNSTSSNSLNTKLSLPIIPSSNSSKSIYYPPTKETPLPSSPSSPPRTTTIPTSNSFKSKTLSFFSSSSSSSLNNTPQPPQLPPSLSLRRISETFAKGIPSNYLKSDFKIEPPTDTLSPAIRREREKVKEEDLFGRWSVFDSVDDDSVLLGFTKSQMNIEGTLKKNLEPNAKPLLVDGIGFMEFISSKGIITTGEKDLDLDLDLDLKEDDFKPRSFNNQFSNGGNGLIKVINHCSDDCECSLCLVNSNPNGLISRGRFKGSGGRGATFGSKLVKEAFKLQQ